MLERCLERRAGFLYVPVLAEMAVAVGWGRREKASINAQFAIILAENWGKGFAE